MIIDLSNQKLRGKPINKVPSKHPSVELQGFKIKPRRIKSFNE